MTDLFCIEPEKSKAEPIEIKIQELRSKLQQNK